MQYGVIMAGGAGTRLWPLSRGNKPKQLLNVVRGKSLLQLSYDRLRGLIPPERIFVCTGAAHAKAVLENLLRIGQRAIVSFPNFGFWKMRLQLLVGGHMPRTENLPATWYDTPNIHFCTIKDFVQLCDEINVKMERAVALDLYGRPVPLNLPWWVWNMFGEQGVFLLSRGGKTK